MRPPPNREVCLTDSLRLAVILLALLALILIVERE